MARGVAVNFAIASLLDSSGSPLSGGKVYFLNAGASTISDVKAIYTDEALTAAAANPVILDSMGRMASIRYASGLYKIAVYTSADAAVLTYDNFRLEDITTTFVTTAVTVSTDTTASELGYTSINVLKGGSFVVGSGKTLTIDVPFTAALFQCFSGSGSVVFSGSVVSEVYPEWFGAVGNGTTDDTTACDKAFASFPRVSFVRGRTYYAPTLAEITANKVQVLLNGATFKAHLQITGNDTLIDLGGGSFDGKLKYAVVDPLVASGSTAITVVNASSFTTADTLQSSYGLGGDGSSPIAITSIVGNTINVASATTSDLPAGSKVGNWTYAATLKLSGDRLVVRNGFITNNKGFGLDVYSSNKVSVEDIEFSESGLQTVAIGVSGACTNVVFTRCKFGNIIDAAKQSIIVAGDTDVSFNDCVMRPYNYDNIFYLGTNDNDDIRIVCRNCIIDAVGGVLDAPYAGNGVVAFALYGTVDFEMSNCTVANYRFFITGDTAPGTVVLNRLAFDSVKFDTGVGLLAGGTTPAPSHLNYDRCLFDTITGNLTSYGNFTDCDFVDCGFDTASSFSGCLLGCNFTDCTGIRFQAKAYQDGTYYDNTTIGIYPFTGEVALTGCINGGLIRFNNSAFPSGTLASIITGAPSKPHRAVLQDINSTLPLRFFVNSGSATLYLVDDVVSHLAYPNQIRGGDWKIPINSRFKNLVAGTSVYVDKSNSTTVATTVSSGTTLVVTDATGLANGDIINVLLDSGAVHVTTINGAPAGTTITLTNAIPSAATAGNGVCAYTVA